MKGTAFNAAAKLKPRTRTPKVAVSALDPAPGKWQPLWAALALLVLTFGVAYPIFHAGYDWDDNNHFLANPLMNDLTGLKEIWLNPWQQLAPNVYYPITLTSFWIQYQFFGAASAGPYHVVSVCLHALNVLLVWHLLRRLKVSWAWLAAAIFAIHPIQVETVAWASEQKTLLSALFYLLAALEYLKFLDLQGSEKARQGWFHYALSMLSFVLAMLSKAIAVTFPAMLLFVIWWKYGKPRWRHLAQLIPAGVIGLAIALLFAWVNLQFEAQGSEVKFTFVQRILIAGHAVWFYVGKLLWPAELLIIYPFWEVGGTWLEYLRPAGVAAILAALIVFRKKLTLGPAVGAWFFVLTLSPALGFISFSYMRYSFVADHFTYLANLGLIAVLVECLRLGSTRLVNSIMGALPMKVWMRPQVVCSVILILLLAPVSWGESCLHADTVANWQYTVERNPGSWLAHAILAGSYLEANRYDDALLEAKASADISNNETALEVAAVALTRQGRIAEACKFFEELISLDTVTYHDYYRYGQALDQLGRHEAARQAFEKSVALNPRLVEGWNDLASCHLELEHWAQGRDSALHCLDLDANFAPAHGNLALALQHLGDLDGAVSHYQRALKLNPQLGAARLQLADCLQQRGDLRGAIAQYQQAIAQMPDNLEAHKKLAKVFLQMGDKDSGQREQQIVEKLTGQKVH